VALLFVAALAFAPIPAPRITPRRASCCDGVVETARPCRARTIDALPRHSLSVAQAHARCHILAFEDDRALTDEQITAEQITALFVECDTSGDGYIDLSELQAALNKAGQPVTSTRAKEILQQVDANNDGQISLDEFRSVFELAPGAMPKEFEELVGGFFTEVGRVLGIELSGQWRTTTSGSRYVDDVVGDGFPVTAGDLVSLHYTVTLMSTGSIVESSRGGAPMVFKAGDGGEAGQGWNDAIAGMRVGGQRRVYAKPTEGDGPTARYDIELLGLEEGEPSGAVETLITNLGGRRSATRLLFALSFVPYLLPNEDRPKLFASRTEAPSDAAGEQEAGNGRANAYVSQQLDALFGADSPASVQKK